MESWLPDFCTPAVAFWCAALGQAILLFLLLAPVGRWPATFEQLALGTLYVQWLCWMNLALLCGIRRALLRMTTATVACLILFSVAAITAGAAAVAAWFEALLGLNALPSEVGTAGFAMASAGMVALAAAAALRYAFVLAQWKLGVAAGARAQFDALQARIRPHFLFNSMNTIAALIRARPEAAEAAVEDLSDLFRAALRDEGRPATLIEDIELAQRYLAIESLRLGDRLRVESAIGAVPNMNVPPLLLQPLVENAVVHGIEPLPHGGTVQLGVRILHGQVVIDIRNPRPPRRTPPRGTGTAVENVRRRLDYLFGGASRMEVDEGDDYYAVRLQLPIP